MQNFVALVDLQDCALNLRQLATLLEQHHTLYVFHCQNQSPFSLSELTELSTWLSSGQLVVLDVPQDTACEYQYAMLVGQLLVLIDPEQVVSLFSTQQSAVQLSHLLRESGINCQWHIPDASITESVTAVVEQQPTWQQRAWQALDILLQPLQGHRFFSDYLPQGLYRRLQQGRYLNHKMQQANALTLTQRLAVTELHESNTLLPSQQQLGKEIEAILEHAAVEQDAERAQSNFHFHASDQVHFELLRQIQQKQVSMPKDIYLLKDLLSEIFPEADAGLIIKALIKRGYIYWNGHEVTYSHEMYLH